MVRGSYYFSDDPVRDAAEYYDWLDEHGVTLEELEKEIFSGYGRSDDEQSDD